ncbi:MAG: hypothetical protein H0X01_01045 [Nitrospira sp.]|nr:hypothetical protein [Nitrospira sp.]
MPKKLTQPVLELTGDFYVERGRVNPYGRVTNWKLMDRKGNKLATLLTQQDALRIAAILSKAYAILQREESANHA